MYMSLYISFFVINKTISHQINSKKMMKSILPINFKANSSYFLHLDITWEHFKKRCTDNTTKL